MTFMQQRSLAEGCIIAPLQGEQLRGILQLQVFHPLPGLLAAVLLIHRSHRVAVFHQVLDGRWQRALRQAEDADLLAHGSTFEHPLEWVVHGADLSPCFLSPFPSSALQTLLVLPLCYPRRSSCTLGLCSPISAYRYRRHQSRRSGGVSPLTFNVSVFVIVLTLFSRNLTVVKCLPANS